MVIKPYIPNRGDIVWLNFTPQSGHEQAGKRPGLVLSPKVYSKISGLALVCPITSKEKGLIFELSLPANCQIKGVVLMDQIRSVDFRARKISFIEKLDKEVLKTVQGSLISLLIEEV